MIRINAIPCASRGRYQEDGSIEQQLEIHNDGISNAITTVGKDTYVIEEYKIGEQKCTKLMTKKLKKELAK